MWRALAALHSAGQNAHRQESTGKLRLSLVVAAQAGYGLLPSGHTPSPLAPHAAGPRIVPGRALTDAGAAYRRGWGGWLGPRAVARAPRRRFPPAR